MRRLWRLERRTGCGGAAMGQAQRPVTCTCRFLSPSPSHFLNQHHSPWVAAPSVAGVLSMAAVAWDRED